MRLRSKCILCALAFLISGCSSVTHFRGQVPENPLQKVAEQAAPEFSATWVDDKTLRLKDLWPIHSILSIGYTRFYADLQYASGELEGDFYLQSNQLGVLFITMRIDTGPGLSGAMLKPLMRKQMEKVLNYAGTSTAGGSLEHNVNKSVIPN